MEGKLFTNNLILLFFLLIGFFSCTGQNHDPALIVPDSDNSGEIHGYNYTALGALVAYPWEYMLSELDTSKLVAVNNSEETGYLKKDFMFELEKDMTVKFWFKADLLTKLVDTAILSDGNPSITYHKLRSDRMKFKKIFTSGSWKMNIEDSSISIDFGPNPFNLSPIKGKFCTLEAEVLCICGGNNMDDAATNKLPTKKICFRHLKLF